MRCAFGVSIAFTGKIGNRRTHRQFLLCLSLGVKCRRYLNVMYTTTELSAYMCSYDQLDYSAAGRCSSFRSRPFNCGGSLAVRRQFLTRVPRHMTWLRCNTLEKRFKKFFFGIGLSITGWRIEVLSASAHEKCLEYFLQIHPGNNSVCDIYIRIKLLWNDWFLCIIACVSCETMLLCVHHLNWSHDLVVVVTIDYFNSSTIIVKLFMCV
jgi:hypothetical protein